MKNNNNDAQNAYLNNMNQIFFAPQSNHPYYGQPTILNNYFLKNQSQTNNPGQNLQIPSSN